MRQNKKRPALIGLTGTNGAGKGEAASFLRTKGYEYFSLSDILREELSARGQEASRDNLIHIGNELRERFGADVLARRIMPRIQARAVIDSIRNPREVEFFRRREDFFLVALDAPIELRYERVKTRGRNESAATLDEFRRKEEAEMTDCETAQQLARCIAMADRIIINDGTLDRLHQKLEDWQ